MKERYEDLYKLIVEMLNFYDQNIKLELEKFCKSKKAITDYDRLFFLQLSKATQTTRAILQLSRSGYVENAFILLRSLLEILINLKFSIRDKQIYPKMFFDYGFYDWYKKLKILSNGEGDFSENCKSILKKADNSRYKQIKKFRSSIRGRDSSWSKKSIEEMADLCGLKNTYYEKIYFYLSQYSHPHSSQLIDYEIDLKQSTTFNDSLKLINTDELLITTSDLYLQLLNLLAEHTKIELFNSKLKLIEHRIIKMIKNKL